MAYLEFYLIDPGYRGPVIAHDGTILGNVAGHGSWSVYAISTTAVFIVDKNGGKVTDEADVVATEVIAEFGAGRDIVYRDVDGSWYRLHHEDGRFWGFSPYRGQVPPPKPWQ